MTTPPVSTKDVTAIISRLRELEAKATKGPWKLYDVDRTQSVHYGREAAGGNKCVVHWSGFDASPVSLETRKANARLITELRNALPTILAALSDRVRDTVGVEVPGDVLRNANFVMAHPRQALYPEGVAVTLARFILSLAAPTSRTPEDGRG